MLACFKLVLSCICIIKRFTASLQLSQMALQPRPDQKQINPIQLLLHFIFHPAKWTDSWVWDCSACSGLRLLLTSPDGTLKLLTHICWHFQVPGPHCEPGAHLVTILCSLVNCGIKSLFYLSPSPVKGVIDSFQLLLSEIYCFTAVPGFFLEH